MATNVRDPRSIITPDAFELSKELLGTPLARPSRRLWAMLIDLTVIGLLTVVTSSITLVVWGAVALFLISMAFRKPGRALGQVGSMLFRGATGCLGLVILVGVLIGYVVMRASDDDFELGDVPDVPGVADLIDEAEQAGDVAAGGDAAGGDTGDDEADSEGGIDLSNIIGGLAGLASLSEAETTDDAVEASVRVLRAAGGSGLDADAAREVLSELVPDDAPWSDDRDLVIARAFEEVGITEGGTAPADRVDDDDAEESAPDEVDAVETAAVADSIARAEAFAALEGELAILEPDEAMARYLEVRTARTARLAAANASESSDAEETEADDTNAPEVAAEAPDPAAVLEAELDERAYEILSARMLEAFAADSLDTMAERLRDTRRDLASTERRAEQAEAELEAGAGGFRGLLRDIWEQAGSAIGLWSVYFTMALTLTGGRTVGKKLMGLRVLRLDGVPLTWWSSFERAGGYVAGIATGTLGFVQVFWDSNRQCVHDKIVGTVVVVDGAEIEPGAWQEAWAAQRESNG